MGLVIQLAKNEKIDLSKNSNVTAAQIGLSWEANSTPSRPFDLDASVLMLDGGRNLVELVFYNKLKSDCGGVEHNGDELEGSSSNSYEEEITVELSKIPAVVETLAISVSIHRAKQLGINFGQVTGALVDVMPKGSDVIRHNLSADSARAGAVIIAELSRTSRGTWQVTGGGKAYPEFADLLRDHGADV
jgi:tellurium resistance protein TerD